MRYHDQSPTYGPPAPGRSAFTLVDLVVAILILGLIAAVSVPRLGTVLSQSKAQAGAAILAADLEYLRDRAIVTGEDISLTFDLDTCSVTAAEVPGATRRFESYARNLMTECGVEQLAFSDGVSEELQIDRFGRFWSDKLQLTDWQIRVVAGSTSERISITPVTIQVEDVP